MEQLKNDNDLEETLGSGSRDGCIPLILSPVVALLILSALWIIL